MTPDGKSFETWLVDFMAFQKKTFKTTSHAVPDEIQLLTLEAQEIEPLLAKAEQYAADASFFYHEAKSVAMRRLEIKRFIQSAQESMAKAECHRQLWARETAAAILNTITSRKFSIKDALVRMGIKP